MGPVGTDTLQATTPGLLGPPRPMPWQAHSAAAAKKARVSVGDGGPGPPRQNGGAKPAAQRAHIVADARSLLRNISDGGSLKAAVARRKEFEAKGAAASITGSLLLAQVMGTMKQGYSEGYWQDQDRAIRDYSIFCGSFGYEPWPAKFITMACYMLFCVLALGHAGTTIAKWRATFKTACDIKGLERAHEDGEERAFTLFNRGIAVIAKKQGTQKKPMFLRDIERMRRGQVATAAAPQGILSFEARHHLLQMLVAHAGFLRAAEHCNGRLRIRDIKWVTREAGHYPTRDNIVAMDVAIWNSKTGKYDAEAQRVLIVRRTGDDAQLDPITLAWDHCLRSNLLGMDSEEALFGEVDELGRHVTGTHVTYATFVDRVRSWLDAAGGYKAEEYAGHSFRAGGFCDALDQDVPLDVAIMQGRWKSSAWKRYRRVTYGMLAFLRRVRSSAREGAAGSADTQSRGAMVPQSAQPRYGAGASSSSSSSSSASAPTHFVLNVSAAAVGLRGENPLPIYWDNTVQAFAKLATGREGGKPQEALEDRESRLYAKKAISVMLTEARRREAAGDDVESEHDHDSDYMEALDEGE